MLSPTFHTFQISLTTGESENSFFVDIELAWLLGRLSMFGMFGINQPAVLGDFPATLWKCDGKCDSPHSLQTTQALHFLAGQSAQPHFRLFHHLQSCLPIFSHCSHQECDPHTHFSVFCGWLQHFLPPKPRILSQLFVFYIFQHGRPSWKWNSGNGGSTQLQIHDHNEVNLWLNMFFKFETNPPKPGEVMA